MGSKCIVEGENGVQVYCIILTFLSNFVKCFFKKKRWTHIRGRHYIPLPKGRGFMAIFDNAISQPLFVYFFMQVSPFLCYSHRLLCTAYHLPLPAHGCFHSHDQSLADQSALEPISDAQTAERGIVSQRPGDTSLRSRRAVSFKCLYRNTPRTSYRDFRRRARAALGERICGLQLPTPLRMPSLDALFRAAKHQAPDSAKYSSHVFSENRSLRRLIPP